jgi:hypothetical protein
MDCNRAANDPPGKRLEALIAFECELALNNDNDNGVNGDLVNNNPDPVPIIILIFLKYTFGNTDMNAGFNEGAIERYAQHDCSEKDVMYNLPPFAIT